jgi:microcystin-dependent protein
MSSSTITYSNTTGLMMSTITIERLTVSSLDDGYAYVESNVLNTTSVIPRADIDPTINSDISALQSGLSTLLPTGCLFQYAGGVAPSGWLLCQGQVLSISSYSNLYSVIGTTYGGNSVSTFALPDLRGRVPVGSGGSYSLGTTGGSETHTLTISQMPAHNHTGTINATGAHTHTYQDAYFAENAGRTGNNVYGLAASHDQDNNFYYRTTSNGFTSNPDDASTFLSTGSTGSHTHTMTNSSTGGGSSFSILQPYITLSYIIKY